jgi:uncharacterized membrane protein
MWIAAAIICSVAFLVMVWFVYECITAPLVDEDENVIEDKWGRMGPPS